MHSDVKHYIIFVLSQGAKIIFSAIAMGVLARLLGPEGLGRWTMVVASATLMQILFVQWVQEGPFIRFGKEEWKKTGKVYETWLARLPIIGVGLILATFLFVVAPGHWMSRLYHLSRNDLVFSFAFLASLIVTVEIQTLFQIVGRMKRMALIPTIITACASLLYLGLWVAGIHNHIFSICILGFVCITIVVWGGYGFYELHHSALNVSHWNARLAKDVLIFAWPILPSTILGYIMTWGNQVIIRGVLSAAEVGLYQTAFQVHSFIVAGAVPITTVLLPKLIEKNVDNPTIMNQFVRSYASSIFLLWLIPLIPMVVILPFVFLIVFGTAFQGSIPVLNLLLVCSIISVVGQTYTVLFSIQKNMKPSLVIMAVMVAVNLSLVFLLVKGGGIQSVAFAFTIAFIVSKLLTYFYHHVKLRESTIKINYLYIFSLIFTGGLVFVSPLIYRLLWGCGSFFILMILSRKFALLHPGVVAEAFSGRAESLGKLITKLFVSNR